MDLKSYFPVDSFDNRFCHVSFPRFANMPPESQRVRCSDHWYCLSAAWLVHHMFSLITSIMMIHSVTSKIPLSSADVFSVCISDLPELGMYLSPFSELAELYLNSCFRHIYHCIQTNSPFVHLVRKISLSLPPGDEITFPKYSYNCSYWQFYSIVFWPTFWNIYLPYIWYNITQLDL